MENKMDVLEEIKKNIEKESVSYGELVYLQEHKEDVRKTGDMLLMQWADIEEY